MDTHDVTFVKFLQWEKIIFLSGVFASLWWKIQENSINAKLLQFSYVQSQLLQFLNTSDLIQRHLFVELYFSRCGYGK